MTKTKPKVAVVLSGCGVFDGAEIHESTFILLALDRRGAAYQCYAPDIDQHHVINHLNGAEMNETRNVLRESARIARGKIKPLSELDATDADALIFPGGFGVAKNLCTLAFDGAKCSVNDEVARVVKGFHAAGKPIAALCIAPAMMAKLLAGAEVTIGHDHGTAQTIEKMGGKHKPTGPCEVVVDAANKLVTAPCYMLESTISQIADGADNAVKELLKLVG
ncbi:MAG: isoprenoid biosynthesis protein ElbB [Rhodospirillales bacterium RIFCSPLOWO2_12_FULL_58_28]|nr:MAG: isoprenoid biosynthesis protein ElbB [Rhodospirillales bacterium RIFCSPLOWO2_02_FULL_58_16]OHC78229.1 MAG: isoprenoid biosynthesis protein ElbB [Rhodospirillales bacterium RIFCSPLOWO2_12_FULL_58_28]